MHGGTSYPLDFTVAICGMLAIKACLSRQPEIITLFARLALIYVVRQYSPPHMVYSIDNNFLEQAVIFRNRCYWFVHDT